MANYNSYILTGEPFESRESIEVLYNGTKYTLPSNGMFGYGATFDEENNEFDFSTYPLAIMISIGEGEEGEDLIVPADTPLPITISAGYTETVDAVWEKVGSGGSEPSGDGYEINNPVLTINFTNDQIDDNENRWYIDNDGYLAIENVSISEGTSVFDTIIFGESDGEDGHDYYFSLGVRIQDIQSASNEVNCVCDGVLITLTDPTQNASIDIELGHNSIG